MNTHTLTYHTIFYMKYVSLRTHCDFFKYFRVLIIVLIQPKINHVYILIFCRWNQNHVYILTILSMKQKSCLHHYFVDETKIMFASSYLNLSMKPKSCLHPHILSMKRKSCLHPHILSMKPKSCLHPHYCRWNQRHDYILILKGTCLFKTCFV